MFQRAREHVPAGSCTKLHSSLFRPHQPAVGLLQREELVKDVIRHAADRAADCAAGRAADRAPPQGTAVAPAPVAPASVACLLIRVYRKWEEGRGEKGGGREITRSLPRKGHSANIGAVGVRATNSIQRPAVLVRRAALRYVAPYPQARLTQFFDNNATTTHAKKTHPNAHGVHGREDFIHGAVVVFVVATAATTAPHAATTTVAVVAVATLAPVVFIIVSATWGLPMLLPLLLLAAFSLVEGLGVLEVAVVATSAPPRRTEIATDFIAIALALSSTTALVPTALVSSSVTAEAALGGVVVFASLPPSFAKVSHCRFAFELISTRLKS